MAFTCLTILANTSIVTLEHYNIQAIVKGGFGVYIRHTSNSEKRQSPDLNRGIFIKCASKQTHVKSSKNPPGKAHKNKEKVDVFSSHHAPGT